MAQASYDDFRATRFFTSLDGLRCFSILLVIWHHSPVRDFVDDSIRIASRGFTGVDFFFVLSGFLITSLMLREEEDTGRISLRGFYLRRVLRIVPLYFLVVTLSSLWFVGVRGYDMGGLIPYYYAFLSNFLTADIPLLAPTWSLSVEEQYYLMWPLLMLLMAPRQWLRGVFILMVLGYAFLVTNGILPLPSFGTTEHAEFKLPIGPYSTILIGALVAILLHHRRGFICIALLLGHRVAPLILFALLFLLWQVLPARLMGWPSFAMHLSMAAIIAAVVIRPDHILAPLMTWRPVARLGAISYGMYLWHLFGHHAGVELSVAMGLTGIAQAWTILLVMFAVTVVVSEASFRWFESFFLRLKASSRAGRTRPAI
ncbi:MAG: acyltransferase [Pseudomonadota bacterium]